MTIKHQKIIAVLLVALLGAEMMHVGLKNRPAEEESIVVEQPLLIWYTDPDVQAYMEAAAAEVSARYQVEVKAELVSEVDYIEKICEKSVAEKMEGPDVYVASSALLEKAALAGLTTPVPDQNLAGTYSEKAVQAVTYDGQPVAWHFYIESCVMLYIRFFVETEEVQ